MLDHANNWYVAIADAIGEAYIALDEHDQVVSYNKAAANILKVPEQLLMSPETWSASFLHFFAEILKTKHTFDSLDQRMETPSGGHIWLRISGKSLIADSHKGYIITFTDITAIRNSIDETLDRLDESQRVFKRIYDYSPIGIGIINMAGTWMDINESMARTFGYTIDEMKGRKVIDMIHPDYRENALYQMNRMIRGEISDYHAERQYMHRDGHYLWIFLAASQLRGADGVPRFYLIQVVDISELKNLNSEAQEKNIILHATSVELQQKIRQLQDFNSIISHNLRGPASALVASTEILPELIDSKEKHIILGHMKSSANAILGTLNDLKEMLDLQVHVGCPFVHCDLTTVVRQVWDQFMPQIVEKNALLLLDLQVPVILYVKVFLENILFNLISNALTYTQHGVNPEVRVSTWEENEQVVLMVQDNGIGIDMNRHQDQLFRYKRKFHRGYESKGIGLFKIRNQIRTFGGDIEVKSEAGKGSSFFVYFNKPVPTSKQDE